MDRGHRASSPYPASLPPEILSPYPWPAKPFCAILVNWDRATLILKGQSSRDCEVTHRLLGQRVLEAAAQGLLGGWPGVLGLRVWQQVLGRGWALGI